VRSTVFTPKKAAISIRVLQGIVMSPNLVALLYLVAGVLFIQALRGLSSPDSSRRGNYLGMIGMTIAVLTTLGSHPPESALAWGLVVGGLALGGGVRSTRRRPSTSELRGISTKPA
jgi:NAD(P) transhydrogenase subunit beta